MLKIFKELRNETKRIVILPIIVGEMVGSVGSSKPLSKIHTLEGRTIDRVVGETKPISASRSMARHKGEILLEYKCPRDYVT